MKRLIFCFALLIVLSAGAMAQNRRIEFESKGSWKNIVEKAKQENKYIFVDCFAEWCGPCKALSANVFTQDKVADFFNGNFVNVKYDMEKDRDGIKHRDEWGVRSYPTLLFIDPETEEVIHKLTEAGSAEWLLEEAQMALDARANMDVLEGLIERYENGERTPMFMADFIEALENAKQSEIIDLVLTDYFSGLTPERMATPMNQKLILRYSHDPLSTPLNIIYEFREGFYDLLQEEQRQDMDAKLDHVMISTAIEFAMNPYLAVWDQRRYDAFVTFLGRQDGPAKDISAVWLNTSFLSREKEWRELLDVMKVVERDRILPPEHFEQYLAFFMNSLGKSNSKAIINDSMEWLDGLIAKADGENMESCIDRYIALYAKLCLCGAANRPKPYNAAEKELRACMEKMQALQQNNGM